MALLAATASLFSKISCLGSALKECNVQQVRNKWVNTRGRRDMNRRKLAKKYAEERLRLVAIKRNNILPPEIQELASKGFDKIPRQSALRQLTPRCVITFRGHGTVYRWRFSRLIFRHLVDYNKMSGIQRAIW